MDNKSWLSGQPDASDKLQKNECPGAVPHITGAGNFRAGFMMDMSKGFRQPCDPREAASYAALESWGLSMVEKIKLEGI